MPPLLDNIDGYQPSPIQKFYSGVNVFVTGATGFLGRILIEKLLRSCPEISTIYILVRNKKDKRMHARIDDLCEDVLFDRLREECPKFRHKLVGIDGDCSLLSLGINQQDRNILTSEVSVVFHVAATVRFDEKLKTAVNINVRGTQELLKLCREMAHLKAVVHVSTAFSNCAENVIEEIFYPTPINSKNLILLADSLSDQIVEATTSNLLGSFPNTYAFTKAVAEHMVQEEGKMLPVAIFRPSIVISTYKEPIKGWINNLYGPTGVTAGCANGVLRSLHCDANVNANIVPVDMCVNALIAIPWEVDEKFQAAKEAGAASEVPIYHYESSVDRPITWGCFMAQTEKYGICYPSINAIWYYSLKLRKHALSHMLAVLFLHYLPALLMDCALFCLGKKPRLLKLYKKIHKFTNVISYFSTKEFHFKSTRVRRLIEKMSPMDQTIFFCDLKRLEWDEFFKSYFKGIRLYLIKEPLTTLDAALKKMRRLYWLHQGCKMLIAMTALRLLWVAASYFCNF